MQLRESRDEQIQFPSSLMDAVEINLYPRSKISLIKLLLRNLAENQSSAHHYSAVWDGVAPLSNDPVLHNAAAFGAQRPLVTFKLLICLLV